MAYTTALIATEYACPRCKITKPDYEFRPSKKTVQGRGSWCKPCTNVYIREYWRKRNASGQRRVRTHEHHRKKCLKTKYGITPEQYNAMFAAQGGVCCICGSAESGNPYGVLCVEHNHETGEVRGLVCQPCNFAIGWYENIKDHPHLKKIMAHVDGE